MLILSFLYVVFLFLFFSFLLFSFDAVAFFFFSCFFHIILRYGEVCVCVWRGGGGGSIYW